MNCSPVKALGCATSCWVARIHHHHHVSIVHRGEGLKLFPTSDGMLMDKFITMSEVCVVTRGCGILIVEAFRKYLV